MRAMVWIAEGTWEACVEHAREIVPAEAELACSTSRPATSRSWPPAGRPACSVAGDGGRRTSAAARVSDEEARGLLEAARARLGRDCETVARRGRVEREVVAACAGADLLVLARDGELRLGPPSLGPRARFVVDHAPCTVVLVWAQAPPAVTRSRRPPSTGAAENRRQAELVEAGALRPSSSIACSRILNFCTLPVTVIGNASTSLT